MPDIASIFRIVVFVGFQIFHTIYAGMLTIYKSYLTSIDSVDTATNLEDEENLHVATPSSSQMLPDRHCIFFQALQYTLFGSLQ